MKQACGNGWFLPGHNDNNHSCGKHCIELRNLSSPCCVHTDQRVKSIKTCSLYPDFDVLLFSFEGPWTSPNGEPGVELQKDAGTWYLVDGGHSLCFHVTQTLQGCSPLTLKTLVCEQNVYLPCFISQK